MSQDNNNRFGSMNYSIRVRFEVVYTHKDGCERLWVACRYKDEVDAYVKQCEQEAVRKAGTPVIVRECR